MISTSASNTLSYKITKLADGRVILRIDANRSETVARPYQSISIYDSYRDFAEMQQHHLAHWGRVHAARRPSLRRLLDEFREYIERGTHLHPVAGGPSAAHAER